MDDLRLAARVDVPVLVTADTQQQRGRCARFIHETGDRGGGPFVTLFVDDLDREEALRPQFEEARGGTLFVDDIARLTRPAQALLLALLVEERMRPRSQARVRVVAGASRHLDTERASGAFCAGLFYRLNLIHIDLMPQAGYSNAC